MTRKRKKKIYARKSRPRKHKLWSRRYCDTCGKSVNISKGLEAWHGPEHEDWEGEYCEERTECNECINGYADWCLEEAERMEW